jgi:hypothetical protein
MSLLSNETAIDVDCLMHYVFYMARWTGCKEDNSGDKDFQKKAHFIFIEFLPFSLFCK